MNTNIKTTNFDMTEQIQNYLDKKLASVDKLIAQFEGSSQAQIEIGRSSNRHKSGFIFRAEANISFDGNSARAVSEKEDLFQAIDAMKDDLVREIDKIKDKKMTMLKKGGKKAKDMMHEGDAAQEVEDDSDEDKEYE
jgi:ribosomal subunit interface protein